MARTVAVIAAARAVEGSAEAGEVMGAAAKVTVVAAWAEAGLAVAG